MSKKVPRRNQAKYAFPRTALFGRALVHACVMFVAALFPCATSSLGPLHAAEPEAPVDQDESSEEEAASLQVRARVVSDQLGLPMLVPTRGGLTAATVNIASLRHSGHRLANNLLAPLRC